jgi:hypothetical protein
MKKQRVFISIVSILAVVAVGLVAYGSYTAGHSKKPGSTSSIVKKPAPKGLPVEIKDSGSTNTPAWGLLINNDGSGKATGKKTKNFKAGTFRATQLKHALDSTKLDAQYGCVRSASFGSVMTVVYNSKTSEGIDCYMGSNPDTTLTMLLVEAIQKAELN